MKQHTNIANNKQNTTTLVMIFFEIIMWQHIRYYNIITASTETKTWLRILNTHIDKMHMSKRLTKIHTNVRKHTHMHMTLYLTTTKQLFSCFHTWQKKNRLKHNHNRVALSHQHIWLGISDNDICNLYITFFFLFTTR